MRVFDLVFPKSCVNCKSGGKYLCAKCVSNLGKVDQTCPMCLSPAIDGMTHTKCKKPQGLDGVYFLYPYKGAIRKALLYLKYKYASDVADEMVELIVKKLKEVVSLPEEAVLIPVPLHKKRKNWRGFNQVEIVGEKLAKLQRWDFLTDLLVRTKYKAPQTDLKKEERRKNIRGVFILNSKYKSKITGKRPIVIFDDVWTTGSTMKEAGKVLKRNGFKNVWGLAIGR